MHCLKLTHGPKFPKQLNINHWHGKVQLFCEWHWIQTTQTRNMVHKGTIFWGHNTLKLTNQHVQLKKFSAVWPEHPPPQPSNLNLRSLNVYHYTTYVSISLIRFNMWWDKSLIFFIIIESLHLHDGKDSCVLTNDSKSTHLSSFSSNYHAICKLRKPVGFCLHQPNSPP